MNDRISVVIPTYNRNVQLAEVVDHLLASDADGFEDIEVLVVDDGSPDSAEAVLAAREVEAPFRLIYVRQDNAGPAAARNNGFRRASNEVVVFVDDDVLFSRDLLARHVQAHAENPGAVIFGLYPYVKPKVETTAYRYLDKLERDAQREVAAAGGKYIPSKIVASGNLSVEKSSFDVTAGVYDESLKTPMAEEIELAIRLQKRGTPIIYVPTLDALHTQPTTIEGKCVQDYKYGLGIAEAFSKLRDIAPPEQFAHTMAVNGPIRSGDPIGLKAAKAGKSLLSSRAARSAFRIFVKGMESVFPRSDKFLFSLYRKVIGVHYFAGIREGLAKFCNIDANVGD